MVRNKRQEYPRCGSSSACGGQRSGVRPAAPVRAPLGDGRRIAAGVEPRPPCGERAEETARKDERRDHDRRRHGDEHEEIDHRPALEAERIDPVEVEVEKRRPRNVRQGSDEVREGHEPPGDASPYPDRDGDARHGAPMATPFWQAPIRESGYGRRATFGVSAVRQFVGMWRAAERCATGGTRPSTARRRALARPPRPQPPPVPQRERR